MSVTTDYGSWYDHDRHADLYASVSGFLNDDVDGDYDVDAIVLEYRGQINERLRPHGISLHQDLFIGPWPKDNDAAAAIIASAIGAVDLVDIAGRHDRTIAHEHHAQG